MAKKTPRFIVRLTPADIDDCEQAASFLQSPLWGRFKGRFGWKPLVFKLEWHEGSVTTILVLWQKLMPFFSMAYVPFGPEIPQKFQFKKDFFLQNILQECAFLLRSCFHKSTVFIRFDPPPLSEEFSDPQTLQLFKPFRKASIDIQPASTVIVDIKADHEELLARMKPKCRYNIGLALKKGVKVTCHETSLRSNELQGCNGVLQSCSDGLQDCNEELQGCSNDLQKELTDSIDDFYKLLLETAKRDGISVHNIEYYRALFKEGNFAANTKKNLQRNLPVKLCLYTAFHENDRLACAVTIFRGKEAVYLYGASSNEKRNFMAPYALQWKAMQDAKAFGCETYDLFGIPPNDDPEHPMAGLYRFKTGFAGRILHRAGSWDFPIKPLLYWLFTKAEILRKKRLNKKRPENSAKKQS
jgi:lipid II:glycine glycyltransferase (peptidoglycan interpeptide bridge formation enzyme)